VFDSVTQSGQASATFRVSSLEKSIGFRFRIESELGEAFMRSELYVIEAIKSGSPPPVLGLAISPDSWTNQRKFTLNWETPVWDVGRDLLGSVIQLYDGFDTESDFYPFPTGDTLTTMEVEVPEAGEFEVSVWLMDEFGNEEVDSARSVTAYFDDVMPDEFYVHWPDNYVDNDGNLEQTYTSDMPRFRWQEKGDYPSGIKEWRLFLKEGGAAYAFNYAYTWSDVTYDENYDDRWVDHAGTPLSDGYYNWYLEAVDQAGNVTISSDTAYFGVDLNPPRITHNNPLTTIDENTTSPALNVSFDDSPGSGVQWGRLNYRRSGSGGGFVAVDLLAGPVNIPGSDIKADGLEYYIDTEDYVGNYGRWPSDTTFHSVRVRTEAPITTARTTIIKTSPLYTRTRRIIKANIKRRRCGVFINCS
jgi:hypothetical protein